MRLVQFLMSREQELLQLRQAATERGTLGDQLDRIEAHLKFICDLLSAPQTP